MRDELLRRPVRDLRKPQSDNLDICELGDPAASRFELPL